MKTKQYNNNYASKLPANRYKVEWAGYCNLLWGKLNILLYLFNNCVKPYSILYFWQVNTWINLQQSSNRIVLWLTDWLMPFTTGFLMNTFMHDSQYPVDYNIIDAVPDPVHYTKPKWKLLNTCYVSRKVLSSGWWPRKWRIKQLKITIFAFKFLTLRLVAVTDWLLLNSICSSAERIPQESRETVAVTVHQQPVQSD